MLRSKKNLPARGTRRVTKVTPPGPSLEEQGFFLMERFDVIEIVLDADAKAYDRRSGQYLRLSHQWDPGMIYPLSDDCIFSLGSEVGDFLTLVPCKNDGVRLSIWKP